MMDQIQKNSDVFTVTMKFHSKELNAFSKSKRTSNPGILLAFARSIKS